MRTTFSRLRKMVLFAGVSAITLIAFCLPAPAQPPAQSASCPNGEMLMALNLATSNDVEHAAPLLYRLATKGNCGPGIQNSALSLALLSDDKDAPQHALTLARMIPKDSLSAIVLGMEALRQHQWAKAAQLYTPALTTKSQPYGTSFASGLAPLLKAWALVGENDPKAVNAVMKNQPSAKLMLGELYQTQKALLAYSLNAPSSDKTMLKMIMYRNNKEVDRRIIFTPYFAVALAYFGRTDLSEQYWDGITKDWLTVRYFTTTLKPEPELFPFSPLRGSAEALLEYSIAMYSQSKSIGLRTQNAIWALNTANDMRQMTVIFARMALSLDPNLLPARIMLARGLAAIGQRAAAREALRHIDPQETTAPWALSVRADLESDDQDDKAVADTYEQLVRIQPNYPPYWFALAQTQARLGRNAEAIGNLNHILGTPNKLSTPDATFIAFNVNVLLFRAQLYHEVGDDSKSLDDLNSVISSKPNAKDIDDPDGYAALIQNMRVADIMARISRSYHANPTVATFRDIYGWGLLIVHHDLKKALPLLQSAVHDAPNNAPAAYHLGVAYWYSGNYAEASQQWNRALANSPDPVTRGAIERALREGPYVEGLSKPSDAPHSS